MTASQTRCTRTTTAFLRTGQTPTAAQSAPRSLFPTASQTTALFRCVCSSPPPARHRFTSTAATQCFPCTRLILLRSSDPPAVVLSNPSQLCTCRSCTTRATRLHPTASLTPPSQSGRKKSLASEKSFATLPLFLQTRSFTCTPSLPFPRSHCLTCLVCVLCFVCVCGLSVDLVVFVCLYACAPATCLPTHSIPSPPSPFSTPHLPSFVGFFCSPVNSSVTKNETTNNRSRASEHRFCSQAGTSISSPWLATASTTTRLSLSTTLSTLPCFHTPSIGSSQPNAWLIHAQSSTRTRACGNSPLLHGKLQMATSPLGMYLRVHNPHSQLAPCSVLVCCVCAPSLVPRIKCLLVVSTHTLHSLPLTYCSMQHG